MSKFDVADSYFSGQGVVMVGKRNADGTPKALYPIGNVPTLKLSLATSTIEHKESHSGQRGTDKRLTTETKCTMSLVMENFIGSNLSMALRASLTSKAGDTVAKAPVVGYKGGITPLNYISVSAFALFKGAVALTKFPGAAGKWDYKLNEDAGSFLINPDSTKFDKLLPADFVGDAGVALLADFTYAAQEVIDAFTEGAEEYWLRFEGLNTADDNAPVIIDVFKFSADPLKELSMISDTLQQYTLDGSVLVDALQAVGSQFFRVTKTKSLT